MTSVLVGKEPIESLDLETLVDLCKQKYPGCEVRFSTNEFQHEWGHTRKAVALFYRRSK